MCFVKVGVSDMERGSLEKSGTVKMKVAGIKEVKNGKSTSR